MIALNPMAPYRLYRDNIIRLSFRLRIKLNFVKIGTALGNTAPSLIALDTKLPIRSDPSDLPASRDPRSRGRGL